MINFRAFLITVHEEHQSIESPEFVIADIHEALESSYTVGQLECGAEGRLHIQVYTECSRRRMGGVLDLVRGHVVGVKVDNGASQYCNKEETRVDGPWSFGEKIRRGRKIQTAREVL